MRLQERPVEGRLETPDGTTKDLNHQNQWMEIISITKLISGEPVDSNPDKLREIPPNSTTAATFLKMTTGKQE
jgi:hypothetical protein